MLQYKMVKEKLPSLIVSTQTWPNDCYGLFNYQSSRLLESRLFIYEDSEIFKNQDDSLSLWANGSSTSLLRIKIEDGKYFISSEKDVWSLIKRKQRISEGDIIKLGKVKLLVKELRDTERDLPFLQEIDSSGIEFELDNYESIFRLPSKGHVQSIRSSYNKYFQCYGNWIEKRRTIFHKDKIKAVSFGDVTETGIGSLYPFTLNIGNSEFCARQHGIIKGPYIVLETIDRAERNVISFSDKSNAKIGRSSKCDAWVDDISVSRVHSIIKYKNGEFFISDNHSKYGTLKLETQKQPVKIGDYPELQVENTLFSIELRNIRQLIDKYTNN